MSSMIALPASHLMMSSIRLQLLLILMIEFIHQDVSGFHHHATVLTSRPQLVSTTITTRWSEAQPQELPTSPTITFGFQSITPKPLLPVTVNADDAAEIQARKHDEPMFTASVRRDLYNVMRNPFQPHLGAPAPLSWWGSDISNIISDGSEDDYEESSQFGGVLLGKRSTSSSEEEEEEEEQAITKDIFYWDTYAFTDRMTYDPSACEGYSVLDDNQIVSAIAIMGTSSTPHAIALTKAFEGWLTEVAACHWGDLEASRLSVEFLIAFGNELTERLGVNHRILSTTLTQQEMDVLSEPQFSPYILPELLEDFQISEIEVDEKEAEATADKLWWDQDENSPEY